VTETPPPAIDLPAPRKVGLIRSSMIFSALTLVSRFMGLARDLVITAKLGASQTIAADAYYTALAFPNLFRRIFAEGAFAAAFVPTYSRKLEGEGAAEADRFASDALATVAAVTIALTFVIMLAMPWVMLVYSPGFEGEKFRLAVLLTQVTMPYLPCMVVAALFSGVLTARGRFIIYGLYPTLLNLVMLAVVLPQHDPVEAAKWASVGVIIAGVSQAALCWWGARMSGARIRLTRPKLTPEMKALIKLALPAAFANSAVQINLFVSAILASQVPGMRAWLNVAERFYQLPLSLVGTAIGVALLPRLAQSFQRGDHADAQAATDQGIVFSLALCLPAAAALVAMPIYLVDGLFARGQFTHHDAAASGLILLQYGWGLPAFVLVKILQPAFFARQDTATPMRYSLISVGVNIVLGVTLFYTVGFQGIAIATSVATWITVLQMALRLRHDGAYSPSARAWSKMGRVAAASLGMGAFLAACAHFRAEIEAPLAGVRFLGLGAKEICVLAVCAVGGAVYPVLLFAFGGVTPTEVRAAFRRGKGAPAPVVPDLP
jgi:putative peptidoglycan lipid II flippase